MSFLGYPPGEVNGPRQWANPEVFEALGPSFWDLVSEPIRWVKKLIGKSEKGLCKGLECVNLSYTTPVVRSG